MEIDSSRLLTGQEAADLLHVSPSLIYKFVRLGKIASVRIGRSIRIFPEALVEFLEANSKQPLGKDVIDLEGKISLFSIVRED